MFENNINRYIEWNIFMSLFSITITIIITDIENLSIQSASYVILKGILYISVQNYIDSMLLLII